jgi:hypothetical protein
LRSQDAGDALKALGAALRKETGALPGSPDGLPEGLIGIAVDNTTQTVFVVVDPTVFSVEGLQRQLQDVVDNRFRNKADAFPVQISASCNSASDLLRAYPALQDKMPSNVVAVPPDSGLIGLGLDPHSSTWNGTLYRGAPGAIATDEALRAEFGTLITVDWADEIPAAFAGA